MKKLYTNVLIFSESEVVERISAVKHLLRGMNILKINAFINPQPYISFSDQKKTLLTCIQNIFFQNIPVGIIAQTPENECFICMEICYYQPGTYLLEYHSYNDCFYTIVKSREYKEIWCAGISADSDQELTITETANASFAKMLSVLSHENMKLDHVIRQWNYIENISGFSKDGDVLIQNYQSFNNIRWGYYNRFKEKKHYPAATGIGTNAGGISIDFFAAKFDKEKDSFALSSPSQINAYSYSQEVLVGTGNGTEPSLKAPLFERGRGLISEDIVEIYISGTASINGQQVSGAGRIIAQTLNTIDNIQLLTSTANLIKNIGTQLIPFNKKFLALRAYIKNYDDIPVVRRICQQFFQNVPMIFVQADVCRHELLVEIEAEMVLELVKTKTMQNINNHTVNKYNS